MNNVLFVTGGAGFIGSAFIRTVLSGEKYSVLNIDKLTYAGNPENLATIESDPRYKHSKTDICDFEQLQALFQMYDPIGVVHLAAESHVDRSISGPKAFIETNILGTYNLLECSRIHLQSKEKNPFRFLHVSTDEVYGSLGEEGAFHEETPYRPNSPYSASKASSDHLVRAWHHTYSLPVVTTNCSNNYGPYQAPEKLIPVVILNAVQERKIPVYGTGKNMRDWLFVDDHAKALLNVFQNGKLGDCYNIGCSNDVTNLEIVEKICAYLDKVRPRKGGRTYQELVSFVEDRKGHDFRYAIDANKITKELGWKPERDFDANLCETIQWYLENQGWCDRALSRLQQ